MSYKTDSERIPTHLLTNTKYIYRHRHATPLTLQRETSLSRPTIAQILKELQQDRVIYTDRLADSTGGRKASLYEFHATLKISVGVEILADHFEMAAVDLYGDMLKYEKHALSFGNEEEYYDKICRAINEFIISLQQPAEAILGVGVALQGLISSDGVEVIYGKVLGCTGLKIRQFTDRIPYRCFFHHDAEAAANVELWFDPFLRNAIYLNIRSDVSGSIIINRDFFRTEPIKAVFLNI